MADKGGVWVKSKGGRRIAISGREVKALGMTKEEIKENPGKTMQRVEEARKTIKTFNEFQKLRKKADKVGVKEEAIRYGDNKGLQDKINKQVERNRREGLERKRLAQTGREIDRQVAQTTGNKSTNTWEKAAKTQPARKTREYISEAGKVARASNQQPTPKQQRIRETVKLIEARGGNIAERGRYSKRNQENLRSRGRGDVADSRSLAASRSYESRRRAENRFKGRERKNPQIL